MLRQWENGHRGLSAYYAELLSEVLGVPLSPDTNGSDNAEALSLQNNGTDGFALALTDRLASAASVDRELVGLFEGQTQSFRLLDRRLGARQLLSQTEAHVDQMLGLLGYSLPGPNRALLAEAIAEAAALAGWQALDLGRPMDTWRHHETAKAAARESGNASVLAHVTAQQAYALLDLDRPADARALIGHALTEAGEQVPALVKSWLNAAHAEALAACGDAPGSLRALDAATLHLPKPGAETLPYLALDEIHLARWRGHCLARIGAIEAVDDLSSAVARHDGTFARAEASLRCDLALALAVRGDRDGARDQAVKAGRLAARTASVRQRRRISRLATG